MLILFPPPPLSYSIIVNLWDGYHKCHLKLFDSFIIEDHTSILYPIKYFKFEMSLRLDTEYSFELTWRYLSCIADELSEMVSEASFRALAAFCSPSAAITWAEIISVAGKKLLNLFATNLCSSFSCCLSFRCHCPLKLDGKTAIFAKIGKFSVFIFHHTANKQSVTWSKGWLSVCFTNHPFRFIYEDLGFIMYTIFSDTTFICCWLTLRSCILTKN